LARVHLDLIDQHTAAIAEITTRIEVVIKPFRGFRDLIASIPGIGPLTADVIVAETGADGSRFPTAGHLASWAGPAGTPNPIPVGARCPEPRGADPGPVPHVVSRASAPMNGGRLWLFRGLTTGRSARRP
jgi:transposase